LPRLARTYAPDRTTAISHPAALGSTALGLVTWRRVTSSVGRD
jgi:hypothetical protein